MTDTPDQVLLSLKPFTDLVGEEVVNLVFSRAPTKIRTRVEKALNHLIKAQRLVGIDDEMGAIRCIAAEEELVVAIFEWLKINADKLPAHQDFIRRFKNHQVKLAFYPVLSQFRFVLSDIYEDAIALEGLPHVPFTASLECDGEKVFVVLTQDGKPILRHNPLDIAINQDDKPETEVLDTLYSDFERLCADQHGFTVRQFVTARADYRNKLLYAEDGRTFIAEDKLEDLLENVFHPAIRDLLWCLAALLSNDPLVKHYGLVSQFIALYRRVLAETKLVDPD